MPYHVEKSRYLKKGSKVFARGNENQLFANMFELKLKDDYEREVLF